MYDNWCDPAAYPFVPTGAGYAPRKYAADRERMQGEIRKLKADAADLREVLGTLRSVIDSVLGPPPEGKPADPRQMELL